MASGRFFADDCRSQDRLAREWTKLVGTNPFIPAYQSDIGKYAYAVSAPPDTTTYQLKSYKPPQAFEFTCLWKKHTASIQGNFELWFAAQGASLITSYAIRFMLINDAEIIAYNYNAVCRSSTKAYTASYPFADDTWYNIKVRFDGNKLMAKWWARGTSEPGWLLDSDSGFAVVVAGSWPNRNGMINLGFYRVGAGESYAVADIRITPIRRAGWP